MDPAELHIPNEWAPLRQVIVGHGHSMGPSPNLETAFDPTSKWHLARGTFPDQREVALQLDGLASVLESEGVDVLRPVNLEGVEQIFARDVGMVIDGVFIRSRTIDERSAEWDGVSPLLTEGNWVDLPDGIQLEGGDAVILEDAIVLGVTRNPDWRNLQVSRTSPSAIPFLEGLFPQREVMGIELVKDDQDPLKCALHLDCAYMPLGGGEALICPEFFVHEEDFKSLISRHSKFIPVSAKEAAQLQTNLLHLSPDTLMIDPGFTRVAGLLRQEGYRLVECPMDKVGRMGGLFRCTTLPLLRGA